MSQSREIKYLVFGGYINSKNDGDEHYINCRKLVQLYGINPTLCRAVETLGKDDIHASMQREALVKAYPKAKILRPLYHGNYREVLKNV